MFGLVYNPRERVTTSHHGSQVSLFFLLTKTVLFLESFLSPKMLFSGYFQPHVHADSLHVLFKAG